MDDFVFLDSSPTNIKKNKIKINVIGKICNHAFSYEDVDSLSYKYLTKKCPVCKKFTRLLLADENQSFELNNANKKVGDQLSLF